MNHFDYNLSTRVLRDFSGQAHSIPGDFHLAVQNRLATGVGTVHRLISAVVGLYNRAIQAHSSECTFAARIGEDLGIKFEICACSDVTSDRSRSYRGLTTKLKFIGKEPLHP